MPFKTGRRAISLPPSLRRFQHFPLSWSLLCRELYRLVNVYMNQYFCPAAIDEPNFQLSELKEYYVPPDGDLQSYKVFVL